MSTHSLPPRGQQARGRGTPAHRPAWSTRLLLCAAACAGMVGSALAQDTPHAPIDTPISTPASAPLGATLQGLLAHARAQSPELRSMRLEAAAAAQRIGPAAALPDPVLRVELMNVNNYGSDAAPNLLPARVGETRYTLMQSFPAWGKRDARRDVAAADARQADARADGTWIELAARIKTAYAEYGRTAGNEALANEVIGLLARLERVAQVRYAAGLAPQQDAIRAQLEQTAMQGELLMLAGERRKTVARLNALLARDPTAPLAAPEAPRPLPTWAPADMPRLVDRVRERNPLVAAERARVEAAQKNRELTQRNRYPDVVVGLAPSQVRSRITTWGVMLEMNIPLQQEPRRSQEQEAQGMASAAQARADALTQQMLGELNLNLAALDTARQTESLLKTRLLPQSELNLQSALSAYEAGKGDMGMLLEAQRQIRKARKDLLESQVEAQMRLAEIERVLGDDL